MEPRKSATSVAFKYAIVVGLVMFIYSIILYLLNQSTNQPLAYISLIFLLGGVYLTIKERRDKDLGGAITYGQGFGAGALFSLFAGLVAAVTTYLMMAFIAPDLPAEMMRVQEEKMIEKGMSTEQIDMAMGFTEKFMSPPMMAVWSLIWLIIIGIVISLILAAILRKEPKQMPQP